MVTLNKSPSVTAVAEARATRENDKNDGRGINTRKTQITKINPYPTVKVKIPFPFTCQPL